MIRTIEVEGFKSIASQKLELGRLNCFIGANGVGKSNVLEAIGVLGAAANGRVDDEAIQRRGVRAGVPRLYKASFEKGRIPPEIALSATTDAGSTFRVSLLNPLDKPQPAWSFKTETLLQGSEAIVSRGVRTDKSNLADTAGLAALESVNMPAGSPAATLLSTLQEFAIYCPNTPTLRGIVPDLQMRAPVGLSGGGLAQAIDFFLQSDERKNYSEWLEGICDDLLDWVQSIATSDATTSVLSSSVPRTGRVLQFTDRFMRKERNTLTAYDASEGALYVLFAAILCVSEFSPKLLAIDNLDQALNPRMVTRLAERLAHWLEASDRDRQLLFTAHNPAILDGLDLTDDEVRLFAVDRNNLGHTCIRRLELTEELRPKLEQYPLSRLWMMGALGAVPNV